MKKKKEEEKACPVVYVLGNSSPRRTTMPSHMRDGNPMRLTVHPSSWPPPSSIASKDFRFPPSPFQCSSFMNILPIAIAWVKSPTSFYSTFAFHSSGVISWTALYLAFKSPFIPPKLRGLMETSGLRSHLGSPAVSVLCALIHWQGFDFDSFWVVTWFLVLASSGFMTIRWFL